MSRWTCCGKEVVFPFICSYCGKEFCAEHRLPENHQCPNLPEKSMWYQEEKVMRGDIEQKLEIKERDPYLLEEDELKEKERKPKIKRPSEVPRKVKAIVVFVVSLVIVSLFFLSWTNFIAQLIMPNFVDTAQVEIDIFQIINEERANCGFPTLLNDDALTTIALDWSEYLAETGNLIHGDFEGRIAQIGYSKYQCGEIIAMYGGWAPALGRAFVDMWLNFSPHYEIMMTPLSGYMGVGVSGGSEGFFAVVDFRFS